MLYGRYWPKFLSEKGNDLMVTRLRRYCRWHQKQVSEIFQFFSVINKKKFLIVFCRNRGGTLSTNVIIFLGGRGGGVLE